MPELTKERLAEIEARAATTHAYFSTKSACDDLRDLIAAVRELQAENERLREGAAEAYQMAGNSDYPTGYMDNFLALAEGDPLPHDWAALMREDHGAKKAARLEPEDYETILGALDGEISEEAAAAERFAPGSSRNKRHLRRVEEARRVRAKIEAARDGGATR